MKKTITANTTGAIYQHSMLATVLVIYMYIQKPECVRWTWSGDVYNRKVICLEWRKKEEEKGKKK